MTEKNPDEIRVPALAKWKIYAWGDYARQASDNKLSGYYRYVMCAPSKAAVVRALGGRSHIKVGDIGLAEKPEDPVFLARENPGRLLFAKWAQPSYGRGTRSPVSPDWSVGEAPGPYAGIPFKRKREAVAVRIYNVKTEAFGNRDPHVVSRTATRTETEYRCRDYSDNNFGFGKVFKIDAFEESRSDAIARYIRAREDNAACLRKEADDQTALAQKAAMLYLKEDADD